VGQETFEQAAEVATKGARPLSQNGFKVTLLKRTLTRALMHVGGGVA
jgi:xanthine dehydrogenase YagS FAD-binding subunit